MSQLAAWLPMAAVLAGAAGVLKPLAEAEATTARMFSGRRARPTIVMVAEIIFVLSDPSGDIGRNEGLD